MCRARPRSSAHRVDPDALRRRGFGPAGSSAGSSAGERFSTGLDLTAMAHVVAPVYQQTTLSVKDSVVGIVADLGTLFWLPRIDGQGHARGLAYTARDVRGAEAATIGLVNRALPDADALLADARATCAAIAANAPLVVEGTKAMLNRDLVADLRSHLSQVSTRNTSFLATQDLQEAVTAFFEKRAPAHSGDCSAIRTTGVERPGSLYAASATVAPGAPCPTQ